MGTRNVQTRQLQARPHGDKAAQALRPGCLRARGRFPQSCSSAPWLPVTLSGSQAQVCASGRDGQPAGNSS